MIDELARKLEAEWSISRRHVERYIHQVHERREKERAADAPYRRENLLRKMERFYAKAMAKDKFGPAAQILIAEARISGAFDHTADRDALIKRLGPPPDDLALPVAGGQPGAAQFRRPSRRR